MAVSKKKKIVKRLSVRQVLDQIDRYLAVGDANTNQLWDVLSALRGPDDGGYNDKQHFTIPIRRAAFPRTAKRVNEAIIWMGPSFARKSDVFNPEQMDVIDRMMDSPISHFYSHVQKAAKALGLTK